MQQNKQFRPAPLVRLQFAFLLVALMAVINWVIHRSDTGTQQIAFRLVVSVIGFGGLMMTTIIRLARQQEKDRKG